MDTIADEDETIPLLDDVVPGYLDFKGSPSVRSKSGCWKSASFIIGSGVAERIAYYGISGNSLSYLTGNLGQSTAAAASILNAWFGTASLLPILGAFVADSFLGRFWTIIVSCVLYIGGLSFLSLSATLHSTSAPECQQATGNNTACAQDQLQLIFYYLSMYLVALAQGGVMPCLQAFGADQFDDEDENECSAKSSFFNWWYCFGTGGILVPLLVLNYIQEYVSWELGFGIPAIVMCLTLVFFLIGRPAYRFRVNTNGANPFARICRVFVKAARNWKADPVAVSIEEEGVLPRTGSHFRFLDNALLTPYGSVENGKLCTANDVEDAKSILRLIPIWFASLGYSIVFAQPATLFTKQVSTIDRHITPAFEIPAASFQSVLIITIAICLPLYDCVLVPAARAITKKPSGISMLQRISFGLLLSFISIMFAAFVERKRLITARKNGLEDLPGAIIPMSIWWFVLQYVLSGIADIFAMVGLQEFFYDQVPSEFKSVGLAMFLSILGVGSLLSSFLVSSIQSATSDNSSGGWFSDNLNRGHLDYFYCLLAGISAIGFLSFMYFTRSYLYRRRINL